MRTILLALALMALSFVAIAADRSAERIQPVQQYTITSFPLYGTLVTPDDNADLAQPGFIRADSAGVVRATCQGNTSSITLSLSAGEYFPCLVKRVYDTDTDAIVIHLFY